MKDLIQNIVVASAYIGIMMYYDWKARKRNTTQSEVYKKVFEESITLLGDKQIRYLRRSHFLQICDWGYARRNHGDLLGLAFLLPMGVMESENPIDLVRYFTDDEMEAVRHGYFILKEDKRTRALCNEFIVK